MRARILTTTALAAICLALGGCSDSEEKPETVPTLVVPDTPLTSDLSAGTIRGQLATTGGPAPGLTEPVAGTVSFLSADGSLAKARVGEDGRYEIKLAPGTYTVRGTSPAYLGGKKDACVGKPRTVELEEGATAFVDVTCARR